MLKTHPGVVRPIPISTQRFPVRSRVFGHEEPDIPDSVRRSTEDRALKAIALRARCRQEAGLRTKLTGIHLELLRLERAAMQWLPQLTFDERMEFVAGAAKLRNVSSRQIESILNQAGSVMLLRDLNGLNTIIDDITEAQTKKLYSQALSGPVGRAWGPVKQRGMATQAIVA